MDAARPIQRAGVLKLAASGSTDGTGIEILNGAGQPVQFGQPMELGPTRTGLRGALHGPLLPDPPTVTTGQANGMATRHAFSYK